MSIAPELPKSNRRKPGLHLTPLHLQPVSTPPAPAFKDQIDDIVEFMEIKANDLETLEKLGEGAAGTVCKVRHKPTNIIMAKKVSCKWVYRLNLTPPIF